MPSKKEARGIAFADPIEEDLEKIGKKAKADSQKKKKKPNDNKTAFSKGIIDRFHQKVPKGRMTKHGKNFFNMLLLSTGRKITDHAVILKEKRREVTVTADGVRGAFHLVFPPKLAQRAEMLGKAAVANYASSHQ